MGGDDLVNLRFAPGDEVLIGGDIRATVEEVIIARNNRRPLYLVEWWHDGQLVARRMHEADCRPAGAP